MTNDLTEKLIKSQSNLLDLVEKFSKTLQILMSSDDLNKIPQKRFYEVVDFINGLEIEDIEYHINLKKEISLNHSEKSHD